MQRIRARVSLELFARMELSAFRHLGSFQVQHNCITGLFRGLYRTALLHEPYAEYVAGCNCRCTVLNAISTDITAHRQNCNVSCFLVV